MCVDHAGVPWAICSGPVRLRNCFWVSGCSQCSRPLAQISRSQNSQYLSHWPEWQSASSQIPNRQEETGKDSGATKMDAHFCFFSCTWVLLFHSTLGWACHRQKRKKTTGHKRILTLAQKDLRLWFRDVIWFADDNEESVVEATSVVLCFCFLGNWQLWKRKKRASFYVLPKSNFANKK